MLKDQTYIRENFDEIMADIRKPGRYVGGEVNSIVKEPTPEQVSFAFAFADLYEIGMCHVGLQIMYALLNADDQVVCERVFAPAPDFEKRLVDLAVPLFSLESRRPLGSFDIIGFSVQYELQYTNILTMLSCAGIPVWASERGADYDGPLIIAGGPCMVNPEPIAPFVDIVVIGDSEEVLPKIMHAYHRVKNTEDVCARKDQLYDALASCDGVYIPSRYEVSRGEAGLLAVRDTTVRKAVVRDLNKTPFPDTPIVPVVRTVHDRATVEVMRGCPRQCKFCQARHTYWPVRRRDAEQVKQVVCDVIRNTGFNEISLQSLSIGDYPGIESVLSELHDVLAPKRVSVSFPSLRIEKILKIFTLYATKVRKTGLTFAVEAATQELRDAIGKDIDVTLVFEIFRSALEQKSETVKLYFMMGLPGETMHDVEAIITFVDELWSIARGMKKKRVKINLGVSTFIPKPHTDFEREVLDDGDAIAEKQQFLRDESKKRRAVKIGLTEYAISQVEAIMARGDRAVSEIIYDAWQAGARLDAWHEHFSAELWSGIIEKHRTLAHACMYARFAEDDVLPWDFIDVKPR